jgi:hypothetical protein
LIGSSICGDLERVGRKNQRRIYRYNFLYHLRIHSLKMTIFMRINKIVFAAATKLEEAAKWNNISRAIIKFFF